MKKNKFIIISLMFFTFISVPCLAIDVKVGDRQVEIKWAPPQYNMNKETGQPDPSRPVYDIFHYSIYRKSIDDPLAPWIMVNRQIIPNYQNYFYDVNLINKRLYSYYVTVTDYAGNESPPSPVVTGKPGRGIAPGRITSLRAWSNENGIVELEWGEATDPDNNIDVYQIYRDLSEIKEEYLQDIMRGRPSRFLPFATVLKSKAVKGMFRYSDIGLPNGTIYYYGVTAMDLDKNEGKASNTIGVRVHGTDIVPPFIERVSHDAVDKPLKAGKVIMVTSTGESGNNITYDLVKWPENTVITTSAGPVEKRPMQVAAQPGLYFALETVKVDYPNNVSIIPRVYYTDPIVYDTVNKTTSGGNVAYMLGDTTTPIIVDTILPERISVISGMVQDYSVKLSWADVNEKVAGYRVYRSGSMISESALDTGNILSGKKLIKKEKKDSNGFLNFIDYNPIPRETYYYAVASVDEAENESISGNLEYTIPDITGPPEIYSVTENTVGAPKKAGSHITITVKGEPGKKYEIKNKIYETKAYFSISKDDSTIVEKSQINEVLIGDRHTGMYEGDYVVKDSDEVDSALITGHLVEPFGNYETSVLCSTYVTMIGISTDTTLPVMNEITVEPVYTNLDGEDKKNTLSDERKKYLVAGNELKIMLKGDSNGVAYFDIGTMRRNIRMKEDTNNPGTYNGSYKIIQGDKMDPVSVTCYLVKKTNGNMAAKKQGTNYKIDTIIIINMDRTKEEISTNETDPIDARSSVITASLRDRHNNPLKNREVEFRLVGGYGSMNPLIVKTDRDGKVKSTYTAGYVVETGYIAAEDRSTGYAGVTYVTTSKTGTVNILLEALTPPPGQRTSNGTAYISLRAKPLRIEANGRSVSVISAFLGYIGEDGINDPYSEDYDPDIKKRDIPIPNVEVKFLIRDYVEDFKRPEYYGLPKAEELELKRGKIEVVQPFTDQNGEAKAVYTAGTKSGLTVIQAIAPNAPGGPVGETIGVVLLAGGVRYLLIEARPIGSIAKPVNNPWGIIEGSAQNSKIKADGVDRAQIRVILLDSYENPVPEIKVYFSCDVGQVLEEGNGLTNTEGKAHAVYTAPILQNGGIGHVSAKVTSSNPLEEGLVNFNLGNKKMIEDRLNVDDIADAVRCYNNAISAFTAVAAGYPYENLLYPLVTKKLTLEEQERAYPDMIWNDDMLYVMGYTYELLGNYDTAVIHYDELNNFYFGGSWADNGSFRKGQVYEAEAGLEQDVTKRKDYISKALSTYEDLIVKFDTSSLADNSMFQMGRIYEQNEFYPKAIETYKKLTRDYSNSDLVNYSWYSIGGCYEQLGQKDEAIKAYNRIFGSFDDLIYKLAQEALKRLRGY